MPSLFNEKKESDDPYNSDIDENPNETQNTDLNILNNMTVNYEILLKNAKKGNLIDQGNFGEVFEVIDTNINKKYAVKVYYVCFEDYPNKSQVDILQHMNIIKQLNFPSVLKCYDYSFNGFDNECRQTILTDYCSYRSLREVIDSKPYELDNTSKHIILYGIAAGFSYLHKHNILHYDLKPSNILLDENLYPKISDIGNSTHFHSLKSMAKIKEISHYIPPEVLISNKYTKESEVYSFALIAYELFTGKDPFGNISQFNLMEKIVNNRRPYLDDSIPDAYHDLIRKCWSQNPEERLTFEEICKELKSSFEFLERKEDFEQYTKLVDDFCEINKPFDQVIRLDDAIFNDEQLKPKKLKKKKKLRKKK